MPPSATTILRPGAASAVFRRRAATVVTALALAWSMLLAFTVPSLAAPGTRVNADPELLDVAIGSTVVLVASVRDGSGNPSVGPDTNTHVRWFFTPESANDPGSPGNSPDLQCWTGEIGTCAVSYVATNAGVDEICALVGGAQHMCDEETAAPEWDDHSDSVERTVGVSSTPSPTPTPVPTPDPTPVPTPDPTPMPATAAPPAPTQPRPPAPLPVTAPGAMPEPATSDAVPEPAQDPTIPAPPLDLEPTIGSPLMLPGPGSVESVSEIDQAPDRGVGGGAGVIGAPPPLLVQVPTPTGVVAQVLAAAITGVTTVVQPAAAVAVASEFTFPITLTVAVVLFLAIQGHIDRRDPKLRLAPQHVVETVVRFEPEDEL